MSGGGLFDEVPRPTVEAGAQPGSPLAERMRPRSLDEVLGQDALVGPNGSLRRAFEHGELASMVFWGPPGTGKTTLAGLLAHRAELEFRPYSAVLAGIKEVRLAMQEAQRMRAATGRRTLVFVDEIHRFNKAQQDAFLPFVERGDIVLVGATTENPSFEIVGPLLSRLTVHLLQPLEEAVLVDLMRRALTDLDRGLGARRLSLTDPQLASIAAYASGDARRALVALEAIALRVDVGAEVNDEILRGVLAGRALLYDKSGERHYDLISALHKSIRSSNPDAALYWLQRMLRSGEDPMFLARRLVRMASEDVGLADPSALRLAVSAMEAYRLLGSPEGELALAQVAVYLAVTPKSNAVYKGAKQVDRLIADGYAHEVPMQLRNAPTKMMKGMGWAEGHSYAHDEAGGLTDMECLPDAIAGTQFYKPTDRGLEARIAARLAEIRAEVARRRGSS